VLTAYFRSTSSIILEPTPFCIDILAQLANIPALSPYMSYFISQNKQEKHSEMHLLIQNHFWHICQKPLGVTLNRLALNVIIHNQKYLLLLSQRRIYFSRITSTIDLCTALDTSVWHAFKGYRLTRGLHSASSPKGSSSFLAYHCIGWLQSLQQYTVLMQGVVIHLERFDSVDESRAWN